MKPSLVLVVAATLAAPLPVLCGQLHIQDFGLADIQKSGGAVYLGTFEGSRSKPPRPKKRGARPQVTVTMKPTQAWGAELSEAPTSYKIYGGIVWTNPRKSPIDRRLRGGVGAGAFKPGDQVVMVPSRGMHYEMLRGDEATLKKLNILYGPGGMDAYIKKAPTKELEQALTDYDFGDAAYGRLLEMNALSARALISAAASNAGRRVLWDFFRNESVSSHAKSKILTEAPGVLAQHPKLRPQLVRSAVDALDENTAPPLGAIASKLDPTNREDQHAMSDLEIKLRSFAKEKRTDVLDPMVGFMATYERHRPPHRSTHRELDNFIEGLSPKVRDEFLLSLVESSVRSDHAGDDGLDQFLFYTALRSMEQHPGVQFLGPVASLADPASVRTTSARKSLMTRLLSLAVGVAKNARWREAVRRFAEPYLRHGYDVDEATLQAYRDAVGPEAPPPTEVERTTLSPGRFEMLPSGYRLALSKEGEFSLYSHARRGKKLKLTAKRTPYYEGIWEDRLYVVAPVGNAQTVEVSLHPKATAAPPLLPETDLANSAKKAAAEKGCDRATGRNFIRWEGVFLLEAEGPRKACTVVVGAFTGNVADVRVAPTP